MILGYYAHCTLRSKLTKSHFTHDLQCEKYPIKIMFYYHSNKGKYLVYPKYLYFLPISYLTSQIKSVIVFFVLNKTNAILNKI